MDYKTLFNLSGKTAMVIGAGSGIGEATAIGLSDFGADIICADLNHDAAISTLEKLNGDGSALQLNITDKARVEETFAELEALDILICTPSVNVRKPMLNYTEEDFDKVVNLNFKGNFFAMQAAGKIMSKQKSGNMILYSSIRSQVVEPGQSVYSATKAATMQMVKTLAAELGPDNVRVNAIAPGVVETPLTQQIKDQPDWYNAYSNRNALGRWAKPSELVGAAIFLASDAASYVTGTLLPVDAGWLAIDGRFTPPV